MKTPSFFLRVFVTTTFLLLLFFQTISQDTITRTATDRQLSNQEVLKAPYGTTQTSLKGLWHFKFGFGLTSGWNFFQTGIQVSPTPRGTIFLALDFAKREALNKPNNYEAGLFGKDYHESVIKIDMLAGMQFFSSDKTGA